jgi:hypothetical protein
MHLIAIIIYLSFASCQGVQVIQTYDERAEIDRLKMKASEAITFCKQKSFNQDLCILIDMSLHSGRERFLIWDFKNDTVMHSFPVSHGCCNSLWSATFTKSSPSFSNLEGSHCSSLGKYKIGERGVSSWGIKVKYLLHGLDASNKNALSRQIVFHSWEEVPDHEVYPDGTPEGWGCPAISNSNMRVVDGLLRTAKEPVLMWIFHSEE